MGSFKDTVIVTSYMCIPVSDVNRSGEWYANHLGFRWNPDPKHNRELKSATGVWIFMRERLPASTDDFRNPVFGFQVSDIRRLHLELQEKGLEVSSMTEDFGGSTFVLTDPDRNRLEMWGGWPNPC